MFRSNGQIQERERGFFGSVKGKVVIGACVFVTMVGSFVAGMYFTKSNTPIIETPQEIVSSDIDWAKKVGLISPDQETYEQPIQGDFLKMVMTQFGDISAKKVDVPAAKNSGYEEIYQSAQFYGVLPCGCKIKPRSTLSLREGAEFVMYAINKKTGEHTVKVQDVEAWVGVKDGTVAPLNYEYAAKMLRKMEEVYKSKNFITRGGSTYEKSS